MSDKNNLVPFLKKDAVVPIEIGTELVRRLSLVAANLVKGKLEEELNQLQSTGKKPEELPEWVIDAGTIYTILNVIYKKAQELGMTEMKDISEVLSQPGNS